MMDFRITDIQGLLTNFRKYKSKVFGSFSVSQHLLPSAVIQSSRNIEMNYRNITRVGLFGESKRKGSLIAFYPFLEDANWKPIETDVAVLQNDHKVTSSILDRRIQIISLDNPLEKAAAIDS